MERSERVKAEQSTARYCLLRAQNVSADVGTSEEYAKTSAQCYRSNDSGPLNEAHFYWAFFASFCPVR